MAKGGPSKKTVEKAKAKLVEDKTFGLKNKNKSKNVQIKIKNVKNTVNQVHDKKTKKEMEEREKKRMEKLLEKKREEELKALFKSADAPKDAKGESSAQTEEEEAAQQEEDLFEQIEEELLEEEEMTIEDIIEKERAKIVGGTPVTLESFTKWKEFKMEQAKKEEDRRKKAALETGHGLTGRDLFEFNKNLFVDDEEAADTDAYARDDDVDEDLFLEDDEDDEEGGSASAEKKSEDEFDPDTWKEPKLPKVLLQEYLVAKKVALPKYESVPLPGNQQGHFVKIVLPHLSREYPPKKVYSNKKNAEHGAALIAYRDLTKTFFS